ncbi:hypothetical protein EVA_08521 [gut metagenome]|uniref:Uncharacterized protein n=1 Tax=gut metagenome TaxID=749906 RepID=J9G7Y2_9ZZZZ
MCVVIRHFHCKTVIGEVIAAPACMYTWRDISLVVDCRHVIHRFLYGFRAEIQTCRGYRPVLDTPDIALDRYPRDSSRKVSYGRMLVLRILRPEEHCDPVILFLGQILQVGSLTRIGIPVKDEKDRSIHLHCCKVSQCLGLRYSIKDFRRQSCRHFGGIGVRMQYGHSAHFSFQTLKNPLEPACVLVTKRLHGSIGIRRYIQRSTLRSLRIELPDSLVQSTVIHRSHPQFIKPCKTVYLIRLVCKECGCHRSPFGTHQKQSVRAVRNRAEKTVLISYIDFW